MKNDFEFWLTNIAKKKNGESYSNRTVNKYNNSLNIIKKKYNIDFFNFSSFEELMTKKSILFKNKHFIHNNTVGKNMYSRSVEIFIEFIFSKEIKPIQKNIEAIEEDKTLAFEEKNKYIESIVNVRNPQFQQHFKKQLIEEFGRKCALCAVDDARLLIASHIIPYSECINKSDLYSSHNGLLLCSMHDALFDKYLITFDETGKILISKTLNKKMYSLFNINENICINEKYMTEFRIEYLKHHYNTFKKQKNI